MDWSEARFRSRVNEALVVVRRILETTRSPGLDAPHKYNDKYLMAEFVTNSAMAAHLNCLQLLGLSSRETLQDLKKWSQTRAVSLRFHSEERCKFDREVKRDVESTSSNVREYESTYSGKSKTTHKTITTITEYFWIFDFEYEIFAYEGNSPDKKHSFQKRSGSLELKTTSNSSPRPAVSVNPPKDLNLTWLFQNLNDACTLVFSIDRSKKGCHTPTRNPDINKATSYFKDFYEWSGQVASYLQNTIFPIHQGHGLDLSKITDSSVFVPVIPLLEPPNETRIKIKDSKSKENAGTVVSNDTSSPVLSVGDLHQFLMEEMRSIQEKFSEFDKMYPEKKGLITSQDAKLIVSLLHTQKISQAQADAVHYLEFLLRQQLVAAIGKEITSSDFTNFQLYYNSKLFKPQYVPHPFCYPVRRPERTPEGYVEILGIQDSVQQPIRTIVKHSQWNAPMHFAINASTKVTFGGDRFLHAFVAHQFEGDYPLEMAFNARARQFSSFIIMIGKIGAGHSFEPKYAMLLQNKDEINVPLTFEMIPPPKQFKDAIASLSPEQQRFAKAYRGMQLGGSLFGICVLQVKPQLEKVLKLPPDSLTKEIKLTQDLMELFIKYQIPSDLLSYDGSPNLNISIKLNTVKQYVQTMQDMIKDSKEKDLEAQQQKQLFSALSNKIEEVTEYGGGGGGGGGRPGGPIRLPPSRAAMPSKPGSVLAPKPVSAPAPKPVSAPAPKPVSAPSVLAPKPVSAPSVVHTSPPPAAARMAPSSARMAPSPPPPPPSFSHGPPPPPSSSISYGAPPSFSHGPPPPPSPSIFSGAPFSPQRSMPAPRNISQPNPVSLPDPRIAQLEKEIDEIKEKIEADRKLSEIQQNGLKTEIQIIEQRLQQLEEALREALLPFDPDSVKKQIEVVHDEKQDSTDFTKIPSLLDSRFEKFDEDSALRATIIDASKVWTKRSQKGLLSNPVTSVLDPSQQEKERNVAFDLLDALTRSGALSIDDASLHVVLAATHCFDKSIMDTLVMDNMNPIEKVERSTLLIAATIHGVPVKELIDEKEFQRVRTISPVLEQLGQ